MQNILLVLSKETKKIAQKLHALYPHFCLQEILQNIKLDIKCFIDSNGPYIYIYIYDAVNTTNIRDKQLRIEMTVKKEMVEKD